MTIRRMMKICRIIIPWNTIDLDVARNQLVFYVFYPTFLFRIFDDVLKNYIHPILLAKFCNLYRIFIQRNLGKIMRHFQNSNIFIEIFSDFIKNQFIHFGFLVINDRFEIEGFMRYWRLFVFTNVWNNYAFIVSKSVRTHTRIGFIDSILGICTFHLYRFSYYLYIIFRIFECVFFYIKKK